MPPPRQMKNHRKGVGLAPSPTGRAATQRNVLLGARDCLTSALDALQGQIDGPSSEGRGGVYERLTVHVGANERSFVRAEVDNHYCRLTDRRHCFNLLHYAATLVENDILRRRATRLQKRGRH